MKAVISENETLKKFSNIKYDVLKSLTHNLRTLKKKRKGLSKKVSHMVFVSCQGTAWPYMHISMSHNSPPNRHRKNK
jgi:hypothetical protein